MKARLIWNYRGHENRLYARGPNWIAFTFPPTRKKRRVALHIWWGPFV